MLLRTVFFVLIVNSAIEGAVRDSDRILFNREEISDKNGKGRREFRKMWPFTPEKTTITFVDDSERNETGYSTSFETWNNRRNNTFNQNTGSSQLHGGNNNHGWGSNWKPFSSAVDNNRERESENFHWGNENLNKNYSSSFNGIATSSGKNSEKRRLLPEDSCGTDLPRRILGGTSADIDEYPWLALLQYRDRNGRTSHDCGGVLISSRYVITAAHCTIGLGVTNRKLKLENVRLGEWDLTTDKDCQQETCSDPLQDIEIEEIINHPNYKPRQSSQTNDIAIIRLRRKANINSFVQPICLPLDDIADKDFQGKKLSVAGWGRTKNVKNSNSNIKMKVDVPVVSWDSCKNFYESFFNDVKISSTQMCAGGEEGRDSCQGDSGGPLMVSEEIHNEFRWFVIGIVSSGPAACGVEGRPSLYTKVSDYNDWILENLRE